MRQKTKITCQTNSFLTQLINFHKKTWHIAHVQGTRFINTTTAAIQWKTLDCHDYAQSETMTRQTQQLRAAKTNNQQRSFVAP